MKIAYITYEYPPEIDKGGIATYTRQIAEIMCARGHQVHVFCASFIKSETNTEGAVTIHRIKTANPSEFTKAVLPVFSDIHFAFAFDLIECPEIQANAIEIKKKFRDLPLVVRLHMAGFIQQQLMRAYISPWQKFRFWFGSIRRGRWQTLGQYDRSNDPEYQFTMMADAISAPSQAQKEITQKEWEIEEKKIKVIPNPFEPDDQYLQIPVQKKTGKQVCFIGKLNTHKGILTLTRAIPLVLKAHPDAIFLLIGEDFRFVAKQMMMSEYIKKELGSAMKHVKLLGGIPHEEIPAYLENTAVCVFPSLWECFGIVCLEAMSAGRMVIGSRNGGMSEILSDDAGMLVDPYNHHELARKIAEALEDESLRYYYGERGREKAKHFYRGKKIGELMENFYSDLLTQTTAVG